MSEKKTGKWVKLSFRDNWGNITVHLGSLKMSESGTHGKLEDQPPQLEAGEHRVRWPDGTEDVVTVTKSLTSTRVSDMGHEYSVVSSIPFATIDHHGAKVTVRADLLDCQFWMDKE